MRPTPVYALAIAAASMTAAGCGGKKEEAGKATEPGAAADKGGEAPVAAPTSAPTGTPVAGGKPVPAAALPADPGAKKAAHLWSRRMGGGEAESGRAIAVAADGGVYVSGMFRDE